MHENIGVLDFGGQYTHLIANRIRRLKVYSEIVSPESDTDRLRDFAGLILSGGPSSVYDADQPLFNPAIFDLGVPVLGLCYGHHLMAQQLGGVVRPERTKEFGTAQLEILAGMGILGGLADSETVWMSHGDQVAAAPPGFQVLGKTRSCPIAAMGDPGRNLYSLQFHPEVTHTPKGMQMLENFVTLCGCERNWTMGNYIASSVQAIRDTIGDRNVFLFVSGGVDSTVAFVLLEKALGADRVIGLHIDNGLMRKNESTFVHKRLLEHGFSNFHVVDAGADFLSALAGVVHPEEKRQIIGTQFIKVRDKALDALGLDPDLWLLGQGTIYPDTIESGGTKNAAVIKTHHNRVALVEELIAQGKIIEPLSQLYKDEVREVGEQLGIPKDLVWRHPFPGPGLGVRALCSDGSESLGDTERRAEAAALEIAQVAGLDARMLPIKSVGVQGDFRTYAHPVALIGRTDWGALERVSTEITNRIPQINRAVLLLSPDTLPPLAVKRCDLSRKRLDLLREADAVAMQALEAHGLMDAIWQMPVVLLPLSPDGEKECIVLRPVYSREAMTARFAEIPWTWPSRWRRTSRHFRGLRRSSTTSRTSRRERSSGNRMSSRQRILQLSPSICKIAGCVMASCGFGRSLGSPFFLAGAVLPGLSKSLSQAPYPRSLRSFQENGVPDFRRGGGSLREFGRGEGTAHLKFCAW
ncbi:MAG: glutamine-hydrolyzing GMP synthase [Candidatus Latescibacterota bacterium]